MELVRFDLQQMQNPEISGVEYQRGTLWGYEVKQYLLEKFNHTCVYCDAQNVPFSIDHVLAKVRGGSDRVSNLANACFPCNEAKDDDRVEDFLAHDPVRLAKLLAQLKTPAEGRGCGQQHPLGAVARAAGDRPPGRDWLRRSHQVEPQPLCHSEDARAGRGLRRRRRGSGRLAATDVDPHRRRARNL